MASADAGWYSWLLVTESVPAVRVFHSSNAHQDVLTITQYNSVMPLTQAPDIVREHRAACETIKDALCAILRSMPVADVTRAGLQEALGNNNLDQHFAIVEQQGTESDYVHILSLMLEVLETWDLRVLGLIGQPDCTLRPREPMPFIERRTTTYGPPAAAPPLSLYQWAEFMDELEDSPQRSEDSIRAQHDYYVRLGQHVYDAMVSLVQKKMQLGVNFMANEECTALESFHTQVINGAQRLTVRDQWRPRRPFEDPAREAAWRQLNPGAAAPPTRVAPQGHGMTAAAPAQRSDASQSGPARPQGGSNAQANALMMELLKNRMQMRSMQARQAPIENIFNKAGANWSGYYYK